jgi:Fic family protein
VLFRSDLLEAYTFAKANELNEKNVSEAHKLLSKNLLTSNWQGKYRTQNMYVATKEGKIEDVAVSPYEVEIEMKKLFDDIDYLLKTELKIEEVFYFASFIHLVFVKIHPWNDGNGRSARLLEKWFLAQKLGDKAWFIQSEKMYYENHNSYYNNIRAMGLEYSELDYEQALPFLLMLTNFLI